MPDRVCSRPDCDSPSRARGLCRTHYDRVRLAEGGVCGVDGCDRAHKARGMCHVHYMKALRSGGFDVEPYEPPEWKDPPKDDSWRRKAKCLQADPEMWFPERGDVEMYTRAKAFCHGRDGLGRCEVIEACLAYAMDFEREKGKSGRWGIFGGLGPGERARLDRKGRAA